MALNLVCVCWLLPKCLFAHSNWGKHAHSDSHTRSTHKAFPHQSSPHTAPGLQFAQTSLTAGCRRMAMVVWPRPDKAAAPFLFYLSVITHLYPSVLPSIQPSDPRAAQHKHLLPLLVFMPEDLQTGWCVLLSLPHHLPLYPDPESWLLPNTGHVCAGEPVLFWT